ncbi:type II secretion system major pseudopilin GspG [Nitrogeniibacter mangrovi]|uniref:Type II secretion system core protein G n=2 Tax=Nitrogeniibacter mangrovi TaxID=2016596 RepID=A0A6C1BB49_9RHOO|nr:type II secretion system major pseudopilin GspG [Nitrogeniibacter mangrovi]
MPMSARPSEAGFTLLELLVVIVVMGMLAAVVTPQVMNMFSGAKSDTARLQIDTLATAVNYYKLDTGGYPTLEQGLDVLAHRPANLRQWRGPYVRKPEHLLDPWGNPYHYAIPGKSGAFDIYTLGADNRDGGEGEDADIGVVKSN